MRKFKLGYWIMMGLITAICSCVKPFVPKVSEKDNTFLVVDGTITADSNTFIKLTRTKSLADTAAFATESGAQVAIEDESGAINNFDYVADGVYKSQNSSLNIGSKYRLKVVTSNGKQYLSDFVEMKATPPIDSVNWSQDNDIFIYVNAHDPSNNTKYYRWDFTETFDYQTPFESLLDFQNGQVVLITEEEERHTCYKTFNSTNILVATTTGLSEDIVSHQLINRIPNDNSKISDRYSILVRQYALTPEAYQYWNLLRQNSEETGGLFDPQPSQIFGNIHCVSVPDEPVIGYVSASNIQQKRIFILNSQLKDRRETTYSELCVEKFIDRDSAFFYLQNGQYLPAYYVTNGPLAIAPKFCVDCRLGGGVTTKPDFW